MEGRPDRSHVSFRRSRCGDPGECRLTPWLLLGVAVLLIAGNALFVAAETGLVTVERTEVDAAAAAGNARAVRLRGALGRRATPLTAAALGHPRTPPAARLGPP